jgi:RNA polymerase sigma-70 factor, ECF subfamily
MAGTTSDVDLMLKVKTGDREAFSNLVRRYRRPLINFLYRFTSNPTASEDLAQEVFVKVFLSASRYEPKAGFSTWIYRIATNAALNYIRDERSLRHASIGQHNQELEPDCVVDPPDPKAGIEEQLIERERGRQIRNALTNLPENQRLALILTKYQELSLKETAAVLKCSEVAVKSLIFRAYSTLRERLSSLAPVKG